MIVPIVLGGACGVLALLYVGFLMGAHRYPSSDPKFRVEETIVLDARKALREQQRKRSETELERLNATFGYPKDFN